MEYVLALVPLAQRVHVYRSFGLTHDLHTAVAHEMKTDDFFATLSNEDPRKPMSRKTAYFYLRLIEIWTVANDLNPAVWERMQKYRIHPMLLSIFATFIPFISPEEAQHHRSSCFFRLFPEIRELRRLRQYAEIARGAIEAGNEILFSWCLPLTLAEGNDKEELFYFALYKQDKNICLLLAEHIDENVIIPLRSVVSDLAFFKWVEKSLPQRIDDNVEDVLYAGEAEVDMVQYLYQKFPAAFKEISLRIAGHGCNMAVMTFLLTLPVSFVFDGAFLGALSSSACTIETVKWFHKNGGDCLDNLHLENLTIDVAYYLSCLNTTFTFSFGQLGFYREPISVAAQRWFLAANEDAVQMLLMYLGFNDNIEYFLSAEAAGLDFTGLEVPVLINEGEAICDVRCLEFCRSHGMNFRALLNFVPKTSSSGVAVVTSFRETGT